MDACMRTTTCKVGASVAVDVSFVAQQHWLARSLARSPSSSPSTAPFLASTLLHTSSSLALVGSSSSPGPIPWRMGEEKGV